jgi:hypothetical protein
MTSESCSEKNCGPRWRTRRAKRGGAGTPARPRPGTAAACRGSRVTPPLHVGEWRGIGERGAASQGPNGPRPGQSRHAAAFGNRARKRERWPLVHVNGIGSYTSGQDRMGHCAGFLSGAESVAGKLPRIVMAESRRIAWVLPGTPGDGLLTDS